MSSVSLSSGVRNSLSALQQISDHMGVTQNRLSTGKKVNSATDNPTSYFTAAGLNARAGDLNTLLDNIGNAVQTVNAAEKGINTITKLVETAKGLITSARQLATTDATGRAALAAQYDEIRTQITSIAEDSGFNGVNLIKGSADDLTVVFSERTSANSLTITGVDLDAAGLALTAAAGSWAANGNLDTDASLLDAALSKLRTTAASFGANGAIVTARQDFTKQLISTLKTGADNLVLADQNEEAATLLALQTRQQLAQTGMSLANQAQQSVLRLF